MIHEYLPRMSSLDPNSKSIGTSYPELYHPVVKYDPDMTPYDLSNVIKGMLKKLTQQAKDIATETIEREKEINLSSQNGYVSRKAFNDILAEASIRGIHNIGWDNTYRPENEKRFGYERSVLMDIVCDKLVRYLINTTENVDCRIKQYDNIFGGIPLAPGFDFSFGEYTKGTNTFVRTSGVISKTPWFNKKMIPIGDFNRYKYRKSDRLYYVTPIYRNNIDFFDVNMNHYKHWTSRIILSNGKRKKLPIDEWRFSIYYIDTPSLTISSERIPSKFSNTNVDTAVMRYDVMKLYGTYDEPKYVSLINKFSKFIVDLEDV